MAGASFSALSLWQHDAHALSAGMPNSRLRIPSRHSKKTVCEDVLARIGAVSRQAVCDALATFTEKGVVHWWR